MKSRNPFPEFVPKEVHKTVSGQIARAGHVYKISFTRAAGKHLVDYYYDFTRHPYKGLIPKYLFKDVGEAAASTLAQRCKCLALLEEFMARSGEGELNPESFILYTRWLQEAEKDGGGRRFADSSVPPYVTGVKGFYSFGVARNYREWSQPDLDAMTEVSVKATRGCRGRNAQAAADKAVSAQTFYDLARAAALEFEQCRQVHREWEAGRRDSLYNFDARFMGIIDPNPLVVFALQGVMRYGLRAEELNALTPADLRADESGSNHEIYVSAPNKQDDYIPVDDTFLEVWRLCEAWSREARRRAGPEGESLFGETLFVYAPTNSHHKHPLMQFSTYMLNQSHLPYFFKKWFRHRVEDGRGAMRPLLHAEGDPSRPLEIDYDKLRHAFGARFAEREKNRAVTRRVMRHRDARTTERYYLHQTRLDHAKKVQIALKPEAVFLAMRLKNPVAAGIS